MTPVWLDPRPRRRRSVPGRIGYVLLWILVVCWIVLAAWRWLGPDYWPVTVAMAYTPQLAAATIVPILLAAVLRAPRLLSVLVLSGCVLASALTGRVFADGGPAADGPQLRIMTANAVGGGAEIADIVRLVADNDVDVLVVTELTNEVDDALADAGLAELLPFAVAQPTEAADGTGLYSRERAEPLPELEPDGTNRMPAARVTPEGAASVELVAVHPVAPDSGAHTDRWRRELAGLPSGNTGAARILAGDFNATLDHAGMRGLLDTGYTDAADATGDGLAGTWRPKPWAPSIALDHVLVNRGISATRTQLADLPGSDHRALLVTVALPAG